MKTIFLLVLLLFTPIFALADTLTAGEVATFSLAPGQQLTVVTAASSTALVQRYNDNTLLDQTSVLASTTQVFGEYFIRQRFRITSLTGSLTHDNTQATGTVRAGANAAITGGTIDATTIGATTPAAGNFTTLTGTGAQTGFTTGSFSSTLASGALTVTGAGSFTARITSTHVNDWIFYNSGASTGFKGVILGNTSGEGKFGIEGGVGGTIVTGSTAYATVLGSAVSKPLEFFTNDTIRLTIAAGGGVTIPGTVATGELTVTGSASTTTGVTLASASGNVGVGIAHANADGKVHVHVATAGAVTANAGADDLVVEGSGNSGASILVPDANDSKFSFGSPSLADGASYIWNYNTNEFVLRTLRVGADIVLKPDNEVTNLTLSGASGSELTAAARDISLPGTLIFNAGGSINVDSSAVATTGNDTTQTATITKMAGTITTGALTTAANADTAVVLTLTGVAAGDIVIVTPAGGTNTTSYVIKSAIATTDTITVIIRNDVLVTTALNGTVKFNYMWMKQ